MVKKRKIDKQWITVDDFGNPYRAIDEKDKVIIVALTLPKSLVKILDKTRGKIPRSRYVREMIEYNLNLERTDKVYK